MKLFSAIYHEKDPFGLFSDVEKVTHPDDLSADGVLILWGGEDIGTSLYDETPNKYGDDHLPSVRDRREIALVERAIELGIPMIGICRGAQMLCVLAGGKLVQHIEGHGGKHKITLHDEEGSVIFANSVHHQMMWPYPAQHKMLATAGHTTGLGEYNKALVIEEVPEVVWFPAIQALCIQPHPEYASCPQEFIDYCIRKVKEYVL